MDPAPERLRPVWMVIIQFVLVTYLGIGGYFAYKSFTKKDDDDEE